MEIKAIPTDYRGEKFRSRLEADWAATLDRFHIAWEYEPSAVSFDGIKYLPDFHLPHQHVWCEVKGPGDDNVEKALEFQQALLKAFADRNDFEQHLVIVLRPSRGGMCVWEGTTYSQDIVMILCSNCDRYSFIDFSAAWRCRFCTMDGRKIWSGPGGDLFRLGELPFVRAPRPFAGRA